jgi:hypothetical protein
MRKQESQGQAEVLHNGFLRACRMRRDVELCESAKSRMNIEDSSGREPELHNRCVTRLWTSCTSLIFKHLFRHNFH